MNKGIQLKKDKAKLEEEEEEEERVSRNPK